MRLKASAPRFGATCCGAVGGLICLVGLGTPAGAVASHGKRASVERMVNASVPEDGTGRLTSSIVLGTKFKGARATDVNLNVGFTSNCSPDPTAFNADCMRDLIVMLFAPGQSHRGVALNQYGSGNVIQDLTFDDESPNVISDGPPSIEGPEPNRLYPPYTGSVRPEPDWHATVETAPMRGRWTLVVVDNLRGDPLPSISTLGSWRLEVRGKRPSR